MSVQTQSQDDEEQHDGFNVSDEVPHRMWTDFTVEDHSEYVHLIPDKENRELRCYRSIDKTGEGNRRIKTTIGNVRFSLNWDEESDEVNGFYLTWMEAKTFMTFLDVMASGRDGTLTVSWWEDSGKEMHENIRTKEETLNLKFTKSNGTERGVQIASTWQTCVHKMANVEGESF